MVFVADLLSSIGVEQEAINQIMAMLEESAGELDGGKPGELEQGSFGASEKGVALDGDTRLAHQHVVTAINELVAGMKGFRANVDRWQADMSVTDDDQGDSYRRLRGDAESDSLLQAIRRTSSCTTSPNFHEAPADQTCDVQGVASTGGQG